MFSVSSNPLHSSELWDNYIEISNILEKIKNLEKEKEIFSKRVEAVDEFLLWLKSNGAKIDGIRINEFSNYDLGLRADVDFGENDLVLEIPRNLIFNINSAAHELKDLQDDMLIHHMPQIALAIALLLEKFKNYSKWKPYLNILPHTYNTILYMTVDEMAELKGSPSLGKIIFLLILRRMKLKIQFKTFITYIRVFKIVAIFVVVYILYVYHLLIYL